VFFGDAVATSSPADARCASAAGYCPLTSANGGRGDKVIKMFPFFRRAIRESPLWSRSETYPHAYRRKRPNAFPWRGRCHSPSPARRMTDEVGTLPLPISPDRRTRLPPHPSRPSRGIGTSHLPLKGKAWYAPRNTPVAGHAGSATRWGKRGRAGGLAVPFSLSILSLPYLTYPILT